MPETDTRHRFPARIIGNVFSRGAEQPEPPEYLGTEGADYGKKRDVIFRSKQLFLCCPVNGCLTYRLPGAKIPGFDSHLLEYKNIRFVS
ncbi:hypothetical protein Q0S20_25650 [Escherichia coli O2:H6]|nr:hypothetical protein [Escherichia coli]ELP2913209.1 hypothetical protein [Escherichia coli O128]EKH4689683.1 hypothetical protein [Escherichia coli]EKP3253431.1 hypothetical protein [Escherichia coli]EKP3349905.1 hypothetical protein [Escherichia coli]